MMTYLLPFDLVELLPCPANPAAGSVAPLREVAFREDAWLPDELDALRAGFAADQDLQAIAERVRRTLSAVRTKIDDLGLRRNSSRPWGELEDEHLARHYGTVAASTIAFGFGRSPAAVYARASLLGLTEGNNPPPYSEWELTQVRAAYAQGVPIAQLGTLIGRPIAGIATLASRLGIVHANAPVGWLAMEQQRALALAEAGHRYHRIAAELVGEGFPLRQHHAVAQVLRKLGYGRGWGRSWLADEDELVRGAYLRGDSLAPLQGRLGRTRTSIAYRAGELGLQGSHARPNGWRTEPVWTDEQIAVLRRDYGRVPTPELAAALGRKKAGVFNKAWSLGLVHGFMRQFDTNEERAIRVAHGAGISLTDLSKALGRDPAVVSKRAIRMGVPFSARCRKAPRGPRAARPVVTLASLLALEGNADIASADTDFGAAPAPAIASTTQRQPVGGTTIVAAMPDVPAMPQEVLVAMQEAGLLRTAAASAGLVLLTSKPPG